MNFTFQRVLLIVLHLIFAPEFCQFLQEVCTHVFADLLAAVLLHCVQDRDADGGGQGVASVRVEVQSL